MAQNFWDFFNVRKNYYRGFTAVETIITIVLIILVGGFILNMINPIKRIQEVNDMRRKIDLGTLKSSIVAYYKDFGKYPQSKNYEIVDFRTNKPIDWGFSWTPYMNVLPKDTGGRHYVYYVSPDLQSFWLYASLERPQDDSSSCHKGLQCDGITQNNIKANACGQDDVCNFGISSGNVSP